MQNPESSATQTVRTHQIQPMGFLYEASLIAQAQENILPERQAENARRHADLLAQLEERARM